MTRKILLRYPDFTKTFYLFTDVSGFQIVSIFVQDDFPLACYSRKLNYAQKNYTTMETEVLSIIESLENFLNTILGPTKKLRF